MKAVNQKRLLVAVFSLGLSACLVLPSDDPPRGKGTRMGNPASQYCVNLGGTLEMREDDDGDRQVMCNLPDGSEVEQWELYRGGFDDK